MNKKKVFAVLLLLGAGAAGIYAATRPVRPTKTLTLRILDADGNVIKPVGG
ncbi:MAG: hypothetical protein PHU23_12620 [Dehalococcoidales bacterium]|nr:hypothetical protein [Dehalococcoidales bacterium]